MAKLDKGTSPDEFPPATPRVGSVDLNEWLLNSTTRIEKTLAALEVKFDGMSDTLTRVEGKLGEIDKEIAGHAKWIHSIKAVAALLTILIGTMVMNIFIPWLIERMKKA